MKATDVIQPAVLSAPIAVNGSKDTIPQEQANALYPWYCSVENGFPDVTMQPLNSGGKPPRGQGMNGLLNVISDQKVYLQNGGIITFDSNVSNAIGGYPQGAILDYVTDSSVNKVISLIDDNTYNFVANSALIDGVHWQDISPLNKSQITNCILESPNGVATYSGGTVSVKSGLKVLIPNGRNTDNTLKNIEYTLSSDVSYTIENSSGALTANFDIYIFLHNDGTLSWSVLHDTYYGKSYPTVSTSYAYFYNSDENKWYLTQDTGSTWNQIFAMVIARANVQFNNSQYATIQSLTPYNTLELLGNKDKNEISGWGLPSSRKISITLGASGSEYTAPANGWFACILDMGTMAVLVNETTYLGAKTYSLSSSTPDVLRCFVPVKRGHRVGYSWQGTPTTNTLYFIYANGDT